MMSDVIRFCYFLAGTYLKKFATEHITAQHTWIYLLELYLVNLARQLAGPPY